MPTPRSRHGSNLIPPWARQDHLRSFRVRASGKLRDHISIQFDLDHECGRVREAKIRKQRLSPELAVD